MPEHTPAPTPHRAVYGFVFFLLAKTILFIYLAWALVPDSILHQQLWLTYLPDKFYALYLPVLVLFALFIFGFFLYPAWNLSMTAAIDDPSTIWDESTIRRCQYLIRKTNKFCDERIPFDRRIGWKVDRYCANHQQCGDVDGEDTASRITNYCDCKDVDRCLLRTNPDYLKTVHLRKPIPGVCDLDISDVSKRFRLPKNSY